MKTFYSIASALYLILALSGAGAFFHNIGSLDGAQTWLCFIAMGMGGFASYQFNQLANSFKK